MGNGAPFGNATIIGVPRRFGRTQRILSHSLVLVAVIGLTCAALELCFRRPMLRQLYFIFKPIAVVVNGIADISIAIIALMFRFALFLIFCCVFLGCCAIANRRARRGV